MQDLFQHAKIKLGLKFMQLRRDMYSVLGYPVNSLFDYSCLKDLFDFNMNNCGDWKCYSNNPLNSFQFEKEVMTWFAILLKIEFEKSWGYVTNGGTQGNMFGCYIAREKFPEGTIYFSQDTHYSVAKIVKMLKIPSVVVKSQENGIIDYNDLILKIKEQKDNGRGKNPIIFANIGTTFKGAIDNIKKIQELLNEEGYQRNEYYIHADAALQGMILPFVDSPQPFTFEDGIDSISVSGHKMIGAPMPCGIVLAKKQFVDSITQQVEYIVAKDKTISGSRNGISPMILWKAINSHTNDDFRQLVSKCFNFADYIIKCFQEKGINAWRHQNSMTVVFPSPSEQVLRKHKLAPCQNLAHIIVMPHHQNLKAFDEVIKDVIEDHIKKSY